jgi:hypothetical protein
VKKKVELYVTTGLMKEEFVPPNKEAIDLESEKLTTITHNDRQQCQKQPRRPLRGRQ